MVDNFFFLFNFDFVRIVSAMLLVMGSIEIIDNNCQLQIISTKYKDNWNERRNELLL